MPQLKDGIDFVTGNVLSFQQMNRMKNNWYSGATAPANPVNGMIWVKNDGVTYVYFGAAWNPLSTAADFVGLTDTPANYAAAANKIVKVNATPDALEFGADIEDLDDVDTIVGQAGKYAKVKAEDAGIEWAAAPGFGAFTDLTDTPGAYAGEAGKFVKVNAVPDALEFAAIAWGDVSKAGSNLTDLATRQHAGLTDITSDQHHVQLHAASHADGQGDQLSHNDLLNTHANPYKLDDLAAPDDNTDLDFSITKHGLCPKGTNVGNFLKDDGTWAAGAGGVSGPILIFDSGFNDLALGNINGKGAYSYWGTWVNASGADCTAEIVADEGNGRMLRLSDQSAVNSAKATLTMTPALSAEVLMGVVEWKVRVSALGVGSRGYLRFMDKDIVGSGQGGYFRGDTDDIWYRSSGNITAHLVDALVDTWYIVRTFFDRLGNYAVWWVDGAFEQSRIAMNVGDKFDFLELETRDTYSGNVFDIKYIKVWSLGHVAG